MRGQFDGTVEITKLIQVGLKPWQPEVKTFGFKLKRKKFTVEPLHLPPDFEEGKTRDGDDSSYQEKLKFSKIVNLSRTFIHGVTLVPLGETKIRL